MLEIRMNCNLVLKCAKRKVTDAALRKLALEAARQGIEGRKAPGKVRNFEYLYKKLRRKKCRIGQKSKGRKVTDAALRKLAVEAARQGIEGRTATGEVKKKFCSQQTSFFSEVVLTFREIKVKHVRRRDPILC